MFNLLKLFKKEDAQTVFRKKVRRGFEQTVKDAKKHLMGSPLTDGLLIQAAIGNFRTAMLNEPSLQIIGLAAEGWIPETIIEEAQRAIDKYLKI